jgi:hypothetical protein
MYVRRRIRVNPPVRHKQRPPSHPRPGSRRNGQVRPIWEKPPVAQVTGGGHNRPRPSRNSPSNNNGSGAYAHTMPARGVFLVRRREVDLVRVASAACCLGA